MVGSAGLIHLHKSIVLVSRVVVGHDIHFIPVLRLFPGVAEGHKKGGGILVTGSSQSSLILLVIQNPFLVPSWSSRGIGGRDGVTSNDNHILVARVYLVPAALPKTWKLRFPTQLPSPILTSSPQDSAPSHLAPPPPASGTPPSGLRELPAS